MLRTCVLKNGEEEGRRRGGGRGEGGSGEEGKGSVPKKRRDGSFSTQTLLGSEGGIVVKTNTTCRGLCCVKNMCVEGEEGVGGGVGGL